MKESNQIRDFPSPSSIRNKIIKIFVSDTCPNCPPAKNLYHDLFVAGYPVRLYNTSDPEGLAEATLYSVLGTPSIIVTEDDEEIASWRSAVPTKIDLLTYICKK